MPNDADFQELERRVAALTQRIYLLEQQLSGRQPSSSADATRPERAAGPSAGPTKEATVMPTAGPPPLSQSGRPPLMGAPEPADALPASLRRQLEAPAPKPERDLESVIGSQWLNRIGMLAMMIGAAYFLKLAFDNDWIGPSGRVAIGLVVGIGLVAWSSRIHVRGYKYFSYSLTALGIGIMYLSLWAAFQLYQLAPAPVAFLAMFVVTASAGMLALRQEAQILAAVAVAGGFATPALLSTGQNRPVALFLYIALLNVFSIVLVALRPWRRLLMGSFVGTAIFFVAWFSSYGAETDRPISTTFATLFFLQFAVLPMIKRLQAFNDQQWQTSLTFLVVALVNPAVYFFELYLIYEGTVYRKDLAWVAVALGAFYILISRQLIPDSPPQQDAEGLGPLHRWLHLAIAVTFLTIAIPLRLQGHWITMGWFVESAVLLWIGDRVKVNFLKRAALAALALGVVRMLSIDDFKTSTLLFNARFATYLLAIAVLSAIAWQASKERGRGHAGVVAATVCINILALLALNAEVTDFFARRQQGEQFGPGTRDWNTARDFTYSALWMLYGTALMMAGFWRKSPWLRWQALVLIAATIAKVFLYDLSSLSGPLRVLSLIALGALLMGISFVYQKDWLKLSGKENE